MWAAAVRRPPECLAIGAGTTEGMVRMKYLLLLYADENGSPALGSPEAKARSRPMAPSSRRSTARACSGPATRSAVIEGDDGDGPRLS
jgi:hypothetical protein